MDEILQEISASTIPPAMDANKIAFGALLGTLPHAEFHDEPGLSWVETGISNDLFNGVIQFYNCMFVCALARCFDDPQRSYGIGGIDRRFAT